jgi:hypothetical protein
MNHTDKHSVADQEKGKVSACPHQGCAFKCCQFQQGNFIVLYPGELEAAIASNLSVAHLQITGEYNGGYKTVCVAKQTATCDGGYKPLDCKSYPYFPVVKDHEITVGLKGEKCPLTPDLMPGHERFVEYEWQRIARNTPNLITWLEKVELVGYEGVGS